MKTKIFYLLMMQILLFQPLRISSQTIIIGYSNLFTIGNQQYEYPNIIGYSGAFEMNNMGQYFTGYSGLFALNTIGAQLTADFSASNTTSQINQPIQFSDLSTGVQNPVSWTWNFGAGASPATYTAYSNRSPLFVNYLNAGLKTVSLTVRNAAGVLHTATKTDYISVNSQNNGISLRIIRTNTSAGADPVVARVGYYYTGIKAGKPILYLKNDFIVSAEGMVNIATFPTQLDMPLYTSLVKRFNNEIILFDQNNTQIGHIAFEYNPDQEKEFNREAILILHNDDDVRDSTGFPYGNNTDGYDEKWNYYKIGEYPLSMLIPPNNTFSPVYSKTPLLLIHGWEGKFGLEKSPDADVKLNETSYWFTTVKSLNGLNSSYDAWQYYYPYNSSHKLLALCLKSALEELKSKYNNPSKKIRLVTHSMGGMVALRYLTHFPLHAKANVEKVLFSAPPMHGSLGANLFHHTQYGPMLEKYILGYDSEAPAVRDMKLGSDAITEIYSKQFPDLNNSGITSDDYFVLLGTISKYYKSDLPVLGIVHEEAIDHHDGIVSISSGSLLDKEIGFATFHGNHKDAVHMQSKMRGEHSFWNWQQNIGQPELLPDIIKQYFSENHTTFINWMKGNQYISAIVEKVGTTRVVVKPAGQYMWNLGTNSDVNYQKGILTIEFATSNNAPIYSTYYSPLFRRLYLFQGSRSHAEDRFPVIAALHPSYTYLGSYLKNKKKNSTLGRRYYFNSEDIISNKSLGEELYKGCAMELRLGGNEVIVTNYNGSFKRKFINFNYCETTQLSFDPARESNSPFYEENTDFKTNFVAQQSSTLPDSLLIPFFVDDQTSHCEFVISGLPAEENSSNYQMKLRDPSGALYDTTYSGYSYIYDFELSRWTISVSDPLPGKWFVWAESTIPGDDTLKYQTIAYLSSKIHAFSDNLSENANVSAYYQLSAGLRMDTISLSDSISVKATIYRPNGLYDEVELNNIIATDSSLVFHQNMFIDSAGYYTIKYNLDGVYNGYHFERALWHQFEAVETIPSISLPDIVLRQQEPQKMLDLPQFIYNVNNYDTLYFSTEIISSNFDSEALIVSLDSLSMFAYLHATLSDTGTAVIRFNCHFDENIISDTVVVSVLLPELSIENAVVNNSVFINNSNIILNYALTNSGSYHSSEYKVQYYITQDSLLQQTDYCLGSKTILHHAVDSLITITDTLQIPVLDLVGNYKLMVVADAGNQIKEPVKSNNQAFLNILMNPSPEPPVVISAIPDDESVHLTWTSNHQDDISGYIIHYGTDSTWSINQIYPLNNDTTYTITGLLNNHVYYFALSAYKIMGVNSDRTAFVSATPLKNKKLHLTLFFEGLYNHEMNLMNKAQNEYGPAFPDTIADAYKLELHDAVNTDCIVFTSNNRVSVHGISDFDIPGRFSGSYYLVVKHRNSIETWSSAPVSFNSDTIYYDLSDQATKAYGSNLKLLGSKYTIYGGDVNQDGAVDTADMTPVDNDSAIYASGYLVTDITGDGVVDTADMTIVDNNSFGYVGSVTP
jgi:PKD repeat protein